MFYARGEGAYVWDVDKYQYIDFVLGRGPLITGHSNKQIIDAITQQYQQGQFFAGQTELEILLAEKIKGLVPGAEMTRFCNSGSEAVHVALRLARSATGREKIIRFEGHYHGWFDNIAWGFTTPDTLTDGAGGMMAMSLGQPDSDADNIISLRWNDPGALEQTLARQAHNIAAIVTEPIMFNSFWSNITPAANYLATLRALCDRYNIVLIFDEIQTGFRTATGGAQAYYGVTPDISTFAKALGGPVCLAAISGKQRFMGLLASTKTIHTGTYNSFPPFLAGALANLDILTANNGEQLHHIHRMSGALRDGLQDIADNTPLPMQIRSSPGALTTTFRTSAHAVNDYRSARHGLNEELTGRWHAALQDQGIRITPEGLWYVSIAHTDEDIRRTLQKAAVAITQLELAWRQS